MDPESSANLFAILIWLGVSCLCIGLPLAGGAALLIWFIRRQWRPRDEVSLAAEGERFQADLDRQATDLRPWSAEALADLSTDWNATWSLLGRDLNVRGTIPGLRDPKGPAWVAFRLKVRGARRPDGQLLARTTAQSFIYRFTPEGVSIQVDGTPWGSVLPDGTLLDAGGQPVGSAPRPGGLPVLFSMGGMAYLRDKRERDYPVTLHGQIIGHLAHPSVQMINVVHARKRRFPPAVTPTGTPTAEEATWLLALAILQVAGHNVLETVWTNRRSSAAL